MTSCQTQRKSLSDIMIHLMETGQFSDVVFVLGDPPNQKIFHAHKLFLATRSKTFQAMFYEENKQEIVINDIKSEIFDKVYNYIYTEQLVVESLEETMGVYGVAHRYQIIDLLYLCRYYIQEQLSPENVCKSYGMSVTYGDDFLIRKCENIISTQTTAVLSSQGFIETREEIVERILWEEKLNIRNESFLLQSVLNWARAECVRRNLEVIPCNLQTLMDPLLPHFRFLSMTQETLIRDLAMNEILNEEELLAIIMNIISPGFKSLPEWCDSRTSPRLQ